LFSVEKLQFADALIDAPVYVPPVGSGLQGMVYHWKSHVLMNNTKVQILDSKAVEATPNEVFDLRGVNFDSATGKLTVEVWANATSTNSVGSFQFGVGSQQASSVSFVSALSNSWFVFDNQEAGILKVGGINSSGIQTPTKLGTLEMTVAANSTGVNLGFSGIEMGNDVVADQFINLAGQSTGPDGRFNFSSITSGVTNLTVSRAIGDGTQIISASDALAALRIAVGLNPNSAVAGKTLLLSPYQVISADMDKNGKISAADALSILRIAVGLTTTNPPEWMFVNEKTSFWNPATNKFTLDSNNATWNKSISATLPQDATTNLVALYKGDVNGSWTAPNGSQDLDVLQPTYFMGLASAMGVPIDLWG